MPSEEEVAVLAARDWQREAFTPRDSVRHHPDGRKERVAGGWNHEHCQVYNAVISDRGEAQRFGYSDKDDHWLCESCYRRYVVEP